MTPPTGGAERTPRAVGTGTDGTGIGTPGRIPAGRLSPAHTTGPGDHASRPAPRSACAPGRPEAPPARCMLGVVGSRPRPVGCGPPSMRLLALAGAAPTRGNALRADSAAAKVLAGPSRSFPSWGPDPSRLLSLARRPGATLEKAPGDAERRETLGPGQLRLRR